MVNFKSSIALNGASFDTLADILPETGRLEILFIAKTPAPISVRAGHYFQGKQGTMFWNMLSAYNILSVPVGQFPDESLLSNNYGITDIVKVPRDYGNEPSDEEYRYGIQKILTGIKKYDPTVIVFDYKKVLDNITKLSFGIKEKSNYGFNPHLTQYFGSNVFVFPMPGTPCRKEVTAQSMRALKSLLKK